MSRTMTFGRFLKEKRKKAGLSLRDMGNALCLSSAYICDIENGKRASPSAELQTKMVQVLGLAKEDEERLYDLAALSKREETIPIDVCNYITSDKDILIFLRKAKSLNTKGEDLLKML